jgi:transposase-like protein
MRKQEFTPEQIITMLREAEVLLSQGTTAVEVSRKLGITEQTYYRWRREYGGMRAEQATDYGRYGYRMSALAVVRLAFTW